MCEAYNPLYVIKKQNKRCDITLTAIKGRFLNEMLDFYLIYCLRKSVIYIIFLSLQLRVVIKTK